MSRAMEDDVRKRLPEITGLLARLVAAETVNPPGNEHRAAAVVTEYLDAAGIPYRRIEAEPGRTNLLAEVGSGAGGLLLACHLDVVPAGEGWNTPPFEPVIRDGLLYGRGACDNKGALAACLVAAKYLAEEGFDQGRLVLACVADEESGSRLGMQYLVDEGLIDARYAIIPDTPDHMSSVSVSEKALLFVKVTSFGRQAHGSTPHKGVNAIMNLTGFLGELDAADLTGAPHRLHSPTTTNVGRITGGTAPNMVPASAEAIVDVRYTPDQTMDEIMGKFRSVADRVRSAREDARFEVEVFQHLPPFEISATSPVVREISTASLAVLGREPRVTGNSGTTVAKQLVAAGIGAIGFSPGDKDAPHTANEYIELVELADFAAIVVRVATGLSEEGSASP